VRVKEKLEAALAQNGPFASFEDMVARARLPRDAMARIAAADGFRSLGLSRREALWMALRQPPSVDEVFTDGGHGEEAGRIVFPELDGHGAMLADYDAMGFSTVSHPVSFLREDFDRRRIMDSRALGSAKNRAWVKIGGMAIVRQRPPTAGNVVFLTLEDEWGFLNLVIRPEIYDHYRTLCRDELFVVVEGTVERAGKAINVQAERFEVSVPNDTAESASIGLPDGHPRHPHRVRESPVAHQASTPQPADSRDPKPEPKITSRDFH